MQLKKTEMVQEITINILINKYNPKQNVRYICIFGVFIATLGCQQLHDDPIITISKQSATVGSRSKNH